ncbi:MAG: PQQ-dependent sugar dehydrogenase [Bacteriovoracaceae bacterium]|nr:PQQ-dependent sugar dehydrogenase [Bacteriovoracaceae bacterium]
MQGILCTLIFSFLTLGHVYAIDLSKIKLPENFQINFAAESVSNARSMTLSPTGILYVGTRDEGKVYALIDNNQDGIFEKKYTLAENLNMPNGVAFHDGDLYVAEIHKIRKYAKIESNLSKPGPGEVIYDKLPNISHHGWKYIAIGPDGNLYYPVGAPCNVCLKDGALYSALHRLNLKSKTSTPVAFGIRNTVGFTWHPKTKDLWFTDNGRDLMGDDVPPCEVNRLSFVGEHFGFPFIHGKNISDPLFGTKKPEQLKTTPAEIELGAHVAPLGIKFYTGSQFPSLYNNGMFIAEHGSWNRSKKSGYKITFIKLDPVAHKKVLLTETFAEGFMLNEKTSGRPVDILIDKDGSMLVSDDYANAIYRITYKKK